MLNIRQNKSIPYKILKDANKSIRAVDFANTEQQNTYSWRI